MTRKPTAQTDASESGEERSTPFGFLIHEAARSLTAAYETRLKPMGLTRSQWRAILYTSRSPGISQTDLAEMLGVGRMSVTAAVDKLEQKGYLRRLSDPDDRRSNKLYLTEAAEKMVPDMRETGRALLEELLVGIDERTQKAVVKALHQIRDNAVAICEAEQSNGKR